MAVIFPSKSIAGWRHDIADAISERGTLHRYERKQVVFHQGAPSDTVFALKTGLVEVSSLNQSGLEITTSIRGPREAFGWSECVLNEPRTRQATVLQESEIWQLDVGEFLHLLMDRPEIMLAALMSVLHRGARNDEMRSEFRGASAYDRVEYVLRRLAAGGEESSRTLRVTHEEISRLCELSRQTVTTILGEMQRKGLVELGLRSITISNSPWLQPIRHD